jgi:hypothetical protein
MTIRPAHDWITRDDASLVAQRFGRSDGGVAAGRLKNNKRWRNRAGKNEVVWLNESLQVGSLFDLEHDATPEFKGLFGMLRPRLDPLLFIALGKLIREKKKFVDTTRFAKMNRPLVAGGSAAAARE